MRRSRHHSMKTDHHGRITDTVSIRERPARVADRPLSGKLQPIRSPHGLSVFYCAASIFAHTGLSRSTLFIKGSNRGLTAWGFPQVIPRGDSADAGSPVIN